MKLAPEVLLEIVAILQDGLSHGKDVSQALRDLDLVEESGPQVDGYTHLVLSQEYLSTHPRGAQWQES